jgi:hypothetical protein
VLRALLWRFHSADGGGRCFPSYEKIAAAARCHRDSVCVALKALEDAGLLIWVHRLTRVCRRDLRARLDRESEERRRLIAMLVDRRPWWRRWFR